MTAHARSPLRPRESVTHGAHTAAAAHCLIILSFSPTLTAKGAKWGFIHTDTGGRVTVAGVTTY